MSEDEAAERAVADVRAGEQAPPVRPPKPSADALTQAIRAGYEFARDPGGELFLLPGKALPDVPYIPRSFLKSDVINLLHVTW